MAENIREIFKRKLVPVGFQRTMGLVGATTLGIGALMGAGIYVLIGLAAGRAGPAVWLSYAVCGVLSLLSVYVFGELSRIAPSSGGGYAFVYNTLGSFWGFFTGWLLALGSIFACTMYAIGFAYYFASVLSLNIPDVALKIVALAVVAFLTLLNCRGAKGGENMQRILTWGNLLVLFILIALCLPKAEPHAMKPMFSQGLKGVGGAISIIYVSFFGYQLIANNADEIIDPKRTIPKAMFMAMLVSLFLYVAVSLVSVMVVPWQTLALSNVPLVDVAQKGIGRSGWLLISIGGILASGAALNSTLQSQARQIFAMGKDRFFPTVIGRIHEVHRTPTAALWAGGSATIAAVVFGDLTFIVKSANFCFLISLLPASFALRKLYRSPENTINVTRVRRAIPYAAFFSNLLLLFTIDVVSMLFGLQLTLLGFVIYFFYSRKREIRNHTGLSLVLTEEKKSLMLAGTRILIPVANPQTQPALFAMAESLLAGHAGEIVMLNVVQATHQVDFRSALANSAGSLDLLDNTSKLPKMDHAKIRPVIRVSRSLSKGIMHAAQEEGCNLIIMGYTGDEGTTSRPISIMEEVISHGGTDLILLKLKGEFRPKKIAVSLTSSSNLSLIVRLAGALADRFDGEIVFINILPTDYTVEQKTYAGKILMEAIRQHAAKALFRIELAGSDQPLAFLVNRSSEVDLLIIGAARVGFLERAVVGPFSSQVVLKSKCSVAVVRVAGKVKKILHV